ncbi:response regulator [bacterium]|nr:response regulator [bacterium]
MKQIKILLVDDEEEFVKTLSERIRMRNISSEVALNGEAALQLVEDEVPDVMVLDLKMPGIDGMEVLKRIKKKYPEVQVIMLTGHGSEKDEETARSLGAFGYLNKPVNLDNLIQHIKNAYAEKVERNLMAATFAEAGEFDTARSILKQKKK